MSLDVRIILSETVITGDAPNTVYFHTFALTFIWILPFAVMTCITPGIIWYANTVITITTLATQTLIFYTNTGLISLTFFRALITDSVGFSSVCVKL